MSCQIFRHKNGKIKKVTAPNGKESLLYKNIKDVLPEKIEPDNYINEAFNKGLIRDFSKSEVALALWSKVYTKEFKEWFGDWKKNPTVSSKIVDKNGEPLIAYHGSNIEGITTFRKSETYLDHFVGENLKPLAIAGLITTKGIFTTTSKYYSENYGNVTYPLYVNMRKGVVVDYNSEQGKKLLRTLPTNKINNGKGAWIKNIPHGKITVDEISVYNSNDVKSIFNHGSFLIDIGNSYYQLSNSEVNEANPNLEKKLISYLNSLGVNVKYVDAITDGDGNPLNAYGKASLAEQVIELVNGKIKEDTLPEEAAHMITGMMGKQHPLIKQMMKDIHLYDVYNEVKNDYADVYNTEEDFRFEAIGKLIGRHIIKKAALPKEQRDAVDNWWNRLLRVLKSFLKQYTFQNVKREMDSFEKFADDILKEKFTPSTVEGFGSEMYQLKSLRDIAIRYNMNTSGFMSPNVNPDQIRIDLDRAGMSNVTVAKTTTGGYFFKKNGKKTNPVQEFYQLNDSMSQEDTVKKLKEIQNSISPQKFIDEDGKEWYVKENGEIIPERVTNVVQDTLFKKNKSKKQIEKIENDPKSVISRHFGIILHDLYENNVNWLVNNRYDNLNGNPDKKVASIAETPPGMNVIHKEAIQKGAVKLLDHISNQQKSIDPSKTATVLTEQTMVGEVDGVETAGTMDVVVVYSDGSVSIYDYKFINYRKELIGEKWVIDPEQGIPFYKRRSYEGQISIYKNMLTKLGVKNFRETRILPNNIQFKKKNKKLLQEVKDLETFNLEDNYLMPLPVVKELTENESLNKILRTLFKESDLLGALARRNYSNKKRLQEINLQQALTSKAIQSIQVNHDLSPLVDSLRNLAENGNKILKDLNSFDDAGELYRLHEEIRMMSMLRHDMLASIEDRESKVPVVFAFENLASIKARIQDKIAEILVNENPEADTPQRELSFLKSRFGYLSKISQPVFEIARKYIKTAFGNINRDASVIIEEAKVKKGNLEKWAKGQGMSLLDAYRKIINSENGNLIYTFSSEFYNLRTKAMQDEDVKWLKEQYEYTPESKKKFEEDYAIFKKSLELTIPAGKGRDIQERLWLNRNDLSKDSAWLDKFALSKYASIKKPEKWYSKEYNELLKPSNKPLKEYFDWYNETNKKFNRLVPERIGKSFVANIQRDVVDSIAQGNPIISSAKQGYKDVINGLRVRQNDTMSGEEGNEIPLIYYDNFMFKDKDGGWKVDIAKKNEDLTSNMILFAESVYRKHHMSNIADIMDMMKLHLSTQQTIKTDSFGKPVRNNTNDGWELEDTTTNVETFDTLIKGLVYNQKMQTKDAFYEINGKVMSRNKTIRSVMSYLSAKALSFNYVSAFGNLMGGYMNTFSKAVGGRYFTTKQMRKAQSMLTNRSDRDKFNHISEYFNVENENWIKKEAAKLSASALTKHLNYDKIYILQQKGDEMIGNLVLGGMMQNYGLNEDGMPRRLETLPEGTKSLMEVTTIKDDKINVEGLTDEGFDEFRNMVKYVSRQIKGSNTKEDINTLQTHLGGQILLQFRNWIAPTVDERFGGIQYTEEVKEWEYGRYISLVKSMAKERFVPTMMKIGLDLITLGRIQYKADNDLLQQQYREFIKQNPLMEGKITVEEYLDLRKRTIKEAMMEARFIAAFLTLFAFMAGDWDDDGQEDYKQWFATRQAYKLMNRAYLELSFYSNPHSINALIKDPIPVLSVVSDVINLGTNTFDEAIDTITFTSDKEEDDKKGKLKYTKKFFIGVKFLDDIIEDYNKDKEKDEE